MTGVPIVSLTRLFPEFSLFVVLVTKGWGCSEGLEFGGEKEEELVVVTVVDDDDKDEDVEMVVGKEGVVTLGFVVDDVVVVDGVVVVCVAADAVVFTVASVNIIQFKLTINNINSMMVVITRIKLVTSLLPLKLEMALVVMVSCFAWQ